jgi:RNA polymerase sigma factor (sigma-70 family)
LNQLQQAIRGAPGNLQDAELLERFIRRRDEAAFEVLLWRHGPMVLGVCRRVLRDMHAAEDAFQATFLLLAQKAASIGNGRSIGSWLYKVAYRVAQRARRRSARWPACTSDVDRLLAPAENDACVSQEQHSLLDDVIQRLPERYRVPVVLCYVEGRKIREAAAELGCPTATVSTRLRRARVLLRRDLNHRGVTVLPELGAAFAVQLLDHAVPVRLANAALRLALPVNAATGSLAGAAGKVAALANEVSRTMLLTKIRMAATIAAGLLLLIAGGATALQFARRNTASPVMPAPRAASPSGPLPHKETTNATGTIAVHGRVLGPDGKPFVGACVYSPHLRAEHSPRRVEDVEMALRAKTVADGRFRFELPMSERRAGFDPRIIATAPGYGCDWHALTDTGSLNDIDLRLVQDKPIRGRILDTEGKPLAGVRVAEVVLFASPEENLDDFLHVWKANWSLGPERLPKRVGLVPSPIMPAAQTDSAGRFALRGLGVERFAKVTIEGAGIAKASLHIVTRSGFDPEPYNRAANAPLPSGMQYTVPVTTLYGPTFEYVAERSRVIEGTVRDGKTHEPLADVSIWAGPDVWTTSDAAGRYRLLGLAKRPRYGLWANCTVKGSWLRWYGQVPDSEGFEPIHFDVSMPRGVMVRGRVVDRSTGKGLQAGIRVGPTPDNRFLKAHPEYEVCFRDHIWSGTDANGDFQMVSVPGASVVLISTHGSGGILNGLPLNRYMAANPDAGINDDLNGQARVDIPEKGDAPSCTVYVDPGRTASVQIEDPDGKPLPGTFVSGLTALWPIAFPLTEPRCTVYAIGATPRTVLFYHKARRLGAAIEVRGDEKQPLQVRLAPTAALTGHVLDRDGKPLSGIRVQLWMQDVGNELLRILGEPTKRVTTDESGRFLLDGLVPSSDVGIVLYRGTNRLEIQRRIGIRRVPPGTMLDLGEIRSK